MHNTYFNTITSGIGYVHKILKIKIPFQILFYPFRCMFKIMKGYKIFAFTPSGKSLKKTLPPRYLNIQQYQWMYSYFTVIWSRNDNLSHICVKQGQRWDEFKVPGPTKIIRDLFGPLFSSFILVKGSLWTRNFLICHCCRYISGLTMLYLGPLLFHFWRVLGVSMGFFRPYKIFLGAIPVVKVCPSTLWKKLHMNFQ